MKLIEFGHYDMASNDSEIKDILLEAIKFVPQTISVFPNNLRIAKSLIQENLNIKLSLLLLFLSHTAKLVCL